MIFQTRHLLLASLGGALIAAASGIAYINSELAVSPIIGFVISTISLASIPGYILCALLTNNIHDANLLLAGVMNFVLYGSLLLWLLSLRSRRKRVAPTRS
jgi:hypothetical protein